MNKTILLTGGIGYIGSHTAIELIEKGYKIIIADNLSNSSRDVLDRIKIITGESPTFYETDISDAIALEIIFEHHSIDSVIHFAGFKSVGESVKKPLMYYCNNINTTVTLIKIMQKYGVNKLIFSSSATVYQSHSVSPFRETMFTGNCTNPYGWTKYMNEQILQDVAVASPDMSVVLLRYFNPIGAHESGIIGEQPNGIPNNLMPYITQVAAGVRRQLCVYGNDYPTHDGTGVRDYVHVVDLAKGHVAALDYANCHKGIEVFNLGTGVGYSVLDIVYAFEKANGVTVPYVIAPRRSGDVAVCYSDPQKASAVLGWVAEKTLEDMCRDSWKWQSYCII